MSTLKEMAMEAENTSRIIKFETLVEDIDNVIKKQASGAFGLTMRYGVFLRLFTRGSASPLSIIYNINELNAFGRVIMEKASICIVGDGDSGSLNPWAERYRDTSFTDEKIKLEAAKKLIEWLRDERNAGERYKYIFWSLMILTVDDTNADEKLSLICDFAKMLKITDDEMLDISYTIKTIYNEIDKEYEFKTDTVPAILGNTFNLYGN